MAGMAPPTAQPHALQVDVHHVVPGRRGSVEDTAVVAGEDPGVVEEHVQATELLGGRGDDVGHLRLIRHVGYDGDGASSGVDDLLDGVAGGLGHHVGDDHGGAFGCEQRGGDPADPAARSR